MESAVHRVDVVLVTGASSGIGLATVLEFARAKHHVIAAVRDPDNVPELREAIARESLSVDVEQLDVTSDESVAQLAARIGSVDVLVNNAGISTSAALEVAPLADAQRIFDVNYFGAVRMMQAVLPRMRQRGRGTIVCVSSISALVSVPALAHYAASKIALETATETLALEVARFGIRVAIVEPGVTKTPMFTRRSNLRALDPRSPYVEDLSALYGYFAHALASGLEAATVASAIVHAVTTSEPRLRYLIGDAAQDLVAARAAMSDESWLEGAALRAISRPAPAPEPVAPQHQISDVSMEQALKQLLAESCPLGVDEIDDTLMIAETGMSSLQLQIFAARVEDHFEIRFGETELGDLAGFAELVAAVARHRGARAAS